ncbi:MAG: MFS transporter [Bacilli bacterium]|nr:MFS transporter [Bacilli bacterium]
MSIKLLKRKDFSLLIFGKLSSLLGSNMLQFALSLYVLSLTESATIFASILSITIFPRLLLSPIAGVFGDWFDRKKSIIILDLVNGIIIGVFGIIYFFNGELNLLSIYIFVILLEITEIFYHSSMSAVIPSMVEKDDLLEANSINSFVMHIGQLIAPTIAALIYGSYGIFTLFVINAVSFVGASLSKIGISIPKTNNGDKNLNLSTFKTDFIEGMRIIRSNEFIKTVISLASIINFVISPLFSIGLIFVIKQILKASDFQYGLFQMTYALSAIIAPLFAGAVIKRIKFGKICFIGFINISLLILIMSLVPSDILINNFEPNGFPYIILLVLTFIMGIIIVIVNIAIGTIFNQIVPLEAMGRTSTVLSLAVTILIPLGQMIFGFLYDYLAPSYVIIICGLILLITMLRYKTALFKYDAMGANSNEVSV